MSTTSVRPTDDAMEVLYIRLSMKVKAHKRLTDNAANQPPRASHEPEKTYLHEQSFLPEHLFCDQAPTFECKLGRLWQLLYE